MYSSLSPFLISAPRIGLIFACLQKSTKSHASQVELMLVSARAVAPASTACFTNPNVEYVPHLKLKYVLQFRYMILGLQRKTNNFSNMILKKVANIFSLIATVAFFVKVLFSKFNNAAERRSHSIFDAV